MTLLTISDYYRERFGRTVEVACSLIIMLSYLGWVSAQVTALGLVFNVLSGGAISVSMGMVIGVVSILAYTLFGGMWSVAVTDFIQMIILVLGLAVIAVFAGNMAGGADKVIAFAASKDLFKFWPEPSFKDIVFFFAAAITMMLGSIPQQDVFQRVMSANSVKAATRGPVIGGVAYILFAFVPMFLVASALLIMPEQTAALLKDDPQKVLPTLVLEKMPFVMQVLFFGALLSAIKSTASATLLAPSVTFTENIWRQFRPAGSDKAEPAHHAHHGAGVQRRGAGLRDPHAGHADLRAGLGRLPGAAGRRLRAAGVRPVLEARHHAGRDRGGRAGHRRLAAVPGHALGRGVPGAAGRAARGVRRHGGRLAGAAVGVQHAHAASAAGRRPGLSRRRQAGRRLIIEGFASGRRPLISPPNPMPIYAYKCSACGLAKDVLQKMSDAPLTVCPACGAERVQQAAHRRRLPAQGLGLVRDRFPRRRRQEERRRRDKAAPATLTPADAPPAEAPPSPPSAPAPAARASPHPPAPAPGACPAQQRLTEGPPCSRCANGCSSGLLVIVPLVITLGC